MRCKSMSESDKNMKGTTTVGFACKDGIIIATKKRADGISALMTVEAYLSTFA